MSNALAIAGVTAVIRDLLNNGLIDHEVTDALGQGVDVTALAPDLISTDGNNARPQLNIFLHQITFNAAWRNVDLPSVNARGARVTNPPLAIDLHYLVTAYGTSDLQAEVLLGYAMQLLHETPVLTREAIRVALAPPAVDAALLPTIYQALRSTTLADQIEMLKITAAVFPGEEMSRLWAAVQTHYRPSVAYQASVVLIQAERGARAPLPVLTRGRRDAVTGIETGVTVTTDLSSPYPDISAIIPPNEQRVVRAGETVEIRGTRLDGTNRTVLLTHPRLHFTRSIPALAGSAANSMRFVVPNDPANLPAGTYLLSVFVQRPGEAQSREAGPLLLPMAPRITSALPMSVPRNAQGTALVALSFEPQVRPEQRISLLLGSRDIPGKITAQTDTLTFEVKQAQAGAHYARLRVDGVESVLVDRAAKPPRFLGLRINVV